MPLEQFPALVQLDWIEHVFTLRTATPTSERHSDNLALRQILPLTAKYWKQAQQIHDNQIAVIRKNSENYQLNTDGLCTQEKAVALIISVADCCAIYAVDPVSRSIGLAHSGNRGTEKNILKSLVANMKASFGTISSNLIIQLSPCIRFPQYPVDFVSQIKAQAIELGITQIYDCETCTASNLHRYYSYRAEKGQTGRMMAALTIKS